MRGTVTKQTMEEKKRPGIPEGQESEYYAGDLSRRHRKEEEPSVMVPGRGALIAGTVWNTVRRAVLFLFSLGGALALTNAGIRERLLEMFRDFITFSGGR